LRKLAPSDRREGFLVYEPERGFSPGMMSKSAGLPYTAILQPQEELALK
jgi:hypothetical protein